MPCIPVDKDVLERNFSVLEDAWGLLDGLRDLLSTRPFRADNSNRLKQDEKYDLYATIGKWYIQHQEILESALNVSKKTCRHASEDLCGILESYAEQDTPKQTKTQKK